MTKKDIAELVSKTLKLSSINKVKNVKKLDKGLTNNTYTFDLEGKHLSIRLPGLGANELVNRENEVKTYKLIGNLTTKTYYIDESGLKISEFLKDVHACDIHDFNDVSNCMKTLHDFHSLHLEADYSFDLLKKLNNYEHLFELTSSNNKSKYVNYADTKKRILKLLDIVDKLDKDICFCHIDSIPDNFLISNDLKKTTMIDFEYAAMQDRLLDVAMFIIYSGYDLLEAKKLLQLYENRPIYNMDNDYAAVIAYSAIAGLVWSNWCEYKENLGQNFGNYSFMQYRYAKDWSLIALQLLGISL